MQASASWAALAAGSASAPSPARGRRPWRGSASRFVHAYAVPRARPSAPPLHLQSPPRGPPVRRFRRPPAHAAVCPRARGAIDPAFFTGPSGARFLLWKREQTPRLAEPGLHQPALRRRAARHRHAEAAADHPGRLGVAADREPGDDPLPRALLPVLLGRLLRRRLLRDRLRALRLAVSARAPGSATGPLLATGGTRRRARAERCRSSTASAGCGWRTPPGTSATPATRRHASCRRTAAGCPQRKLHVATLGVRADGDVGGGRPWLGGWRVVGLVVALLLVSACLRGRRQRRTARPRSGATRSGPGRRTPATSRTRRCCASAAPSTPYSTTVAALNLPMMTSTRPAHLDAAAVVRPGQAVPERRHAGRRLVGADEGDAGRKGVLADLGAVGGARWWPGRYVAAYAVPRAGDGRRCISIAQRQRAAGAVRRPHHRPADLRAPRRHRPADLPRPRGGAGCSTRWGSPDRLVVRRLTASATGVRAGEPQLRAAGAADVAWEGRAVENPAMIRFHGRLYLFYSANGYETARVRHRVRRLHGGHRAVHADGPAALDRALPRRPGRCDAVPRPGRSAAAGLPRLADRATSATRAPTAACGTSAGCPQRRMYVATLAAGQAGQARRPPAVLSATDRTASLAR